MLAQKRQHAHTDTRTRTHVHTHARNFQRNCAQVKMRLYEHKFCSKTSTITSQKFSSKSDYMNKNFAQSMNFAQKLQLSFFSQNDRI